MEKSWRHVFPVVSVALAIWGCSSGPVRTQEASDNRISTFKTYQWISPDDARILRLDQPNIDYIAGSTRVERDPDIEQKVKKDADQRLHEKGYSTVSAPEQADFFVTFYAQQPDGDWLSTWEGFTPAIDGVPVVIFPDFDRSRLRTYREGIVYLVIYDSKTKQAAWSGSVNKKDFGPDFNQAALASAVNQLVDNFASVS